MLSTSSRSRAVGALHFLLGAVILSFSACGKDSTGTSEVVTRLTITNVPELPLLTGDSLRLAVTATNAAGGVVVRPTLTWSSSALAVATVREDGTVVGRAPGEAQLTVTADGVQAAAMVRVVDGAFIGPAGGVARTSDGWVELEFPPGALLAPAQITIEKVASLPADDRLIPGSGYAVQGAGQIMAPATLRIGFERSTVPNGLPVETVKAYQLNDDSTWRRLISTFDAEGEVVTTSVHYNATYALRSTPVDTIQLTEGPDWGVLYTGTTTNLDVRVLADSAPVLPMPPLDWVSSDPGVASVSASGSVTGRAPGAVTISASVDGKVLRIPLTVLAAFEADWSGVGDWSTYRGDAGRSGFVDAVLDPLVFREQWAREPFFDQLVHPATTGDGALFLATRRGGSPQQIVRVDQETGAVEASVTLPHAVKLEQPTFDDGQLSILSTGRWDSSFVTLLNAESLAPGDGTFYESELGRWAAPLVTGTRILLGASGGLRGFDRRTSAELFFVATAAGEEWTPSLGSDGLVYAGGGGVLAIDPADGEVVTRLTDARLSAPTTPALMGADRLVTIADGRLAAVELPALRVSWEKMGDYRGMAAVGNGAVFAARGNEVVALRASDGALLWQWAPPGGQGSPDAVSLLLTRNILFAGVREEAGSGATYAIDVASGLPIWSYPMGGHLALSREGYLTIIYDSWVALIDVR